MKGQDSKKCHQGGRSRVEGRSCSVITNAVRAIIRCAPERATVTEL